MSKIIKLTLGDIVIVDDDDYKYIGQYSWYSKEFTPHRYAARSGPYIKNQTRTTILMHRLIMDCPKGMHVDHINGNTLDNRKVNLRVCTTGQNQMNSKIRSTNTSGYKGVSKLPNGMFRAQIQVNGNKYHLGQHDSPELAHAAYCKGSKKYHGEFGNEG